MPKKKAKPYGWVVRYEDGSYFLSRILGPDALVQTITEATVFDSPAEALDYAEGGKPVPVYLTLVEPEGEDN